MYQRYGGGNMDEGWTRLMFEQFNVPFKSLMDAELKKGDLNASYDVIVLPADSVAAMTGERPQEGGGGGAAAAAAPARRGQDITPAEYRSGFGADGVKALQGFVQKGGTLVTFGQAGDLPIQRFGLPLRNVVAGLPSKEFWAPGSTLRVRFDTRHSLAYGMPAEGLALFLAGSQAYEVTSTETSQDVEIFSTYVERDILQSGWLLGEQVIAKKAAAVAVKYGSGRVVLIGFRPQHRDQTHGTFKLVFNALLSAPAGRRVAHVSSGRRGGSSLLSGKTVRSLVADRRQRDRRVPRGGRGRGRRRARREPKRIATAPSVAGSNGCTPNSRPRIQRVDQHRGSPRRARSRRRIRAPCARTIRSSCAGRAPSATRTPNSGRRCATV